MNSQDILNLLLIGISQGCAYGLVALGFVLIYKATEVVNFSHGEFMMLGGFVSLPLIGFFGFWPGIICAVLAMAVTGFLLDSLVMRRIIGESQASVFILTVAFGFIFRSFAGLGLGSNSVSRLFHRKLEYWRPDHAYQPHSDHRCDCGSMCFALPVFLPHQSWHRDAGG